MSIIDVLFIGIYFYIGYLIAHYVAVHYGPFYAPFGFIAGVCLGMLAWRLICYAVERTMDARRRRK